MAGWLTKAKGAFGGKRRPAMPFEVTSSSGRVVAGMRRETHQVVTCPATGERLFVLPMDAYPPLRTPPTSRGKGGTKRKSRRRRDREPVKDRETTSSSAAPAPRHRRPLRERVLPIREGVGRLRSWFTPLRLLVAGVAACLVLTTWWVLRSQALADAEITLRDSTTNAWAALGAGDVTAANEAFTAAIGALDTLGRDDRTLRTAAREVDVALHLAPAGLVDVLGDPVSFESHAGEWVVFDAAVFTSRDDDGRPIVLVEYPFEVHGVPLEVQADPALFNGLALPGASDPNPFGVVFASQLGSLRPPDGEFGYWTLTLKPGSGFLWVHGETIGAVGIEPDDFRTAAELEALLERQAAAVGEIE